MSAGSARQSVLTAAGNSAEGGKTQAGPRDGMKDGVGVDPASEKNPLPEVPTPE